VATPDPYQHWSGAPKHWVHVPSQRCCPPAPDQLTAAARRAERGTGARAEWSVAAVALAVAVAAFVLIGTGSAVTDCDRPAPAGTSGTPVP
jgi:hypothetical protein